ncbi:hypothetical protein FB45DRAFT_1062981 [Roridomyces roridus]|uniref:DUF6534 domain-containing protein n=1 Tax=Roridomyces roridus TaxID=1738132 RepID=A0AAD7BG18_9AGAR|nr:hypothetical protein FB45DRAFT_1062981 [Roridomyces roridus]
MGIFDAAFGTSLIGTWAASLLTGLAFAQAVQYFSMYPNDGLERKALVGFSLLFCCVGLLGAYVDVYVPTVTFWGDLAALSKETWSVPIYEIFITLTGTTVNSYLISRFYFLSKSILFTGILICMTLFTFIMAFVSSLLYPGVENFSKGQTLGLIWVTSSAGCAVYFCCIFYKAKERGIDVSITLSLVWILRRFGTRTTIEGTINRTIRRIMVLSVQNGCMTSLISVAATIAIVFKIDSNIPTCFLFQLGPLYVLTLLSNLRLRQPEKSGSRQWSSSRSRSNRNYASVVIDGLNIQTSAPNVQRESSVVLEMGNMGRSAGPKQDTAVPADFKV